MIIGIIGLVLSIAFWSSWGGVGGYRRTTRVRTGSNLERNGRRVVDPRDTEYVEEERGY